MDVQTCARFELKQKFESTTPTVCFSLKQTQVGMSIIHPRADGPFPLSLPLFFCYSEDTLVWVFYLSPSKKYIVHAS